MDRGFKDRVWVINSVVNGIDSLRLLSPESQSIGFISPKRELRVVYGPLPPPSRNQGDLPSHGLTNAL